MRRLFLVLTIISRFPHGSSSQSVKTLQWTLLQNSQPTVYIPPKQPPPLQWKYPQPLTRLRNNHHHSSTSSTITPPETTTTAPTASSAREEQENNVSEEWEIVFESQINSLTVNNSGQALFLMIVMTRGL